MLVPVFTVNLGNKILPRRLVVGNFDGEHPCIAAATTADQILIHSPHSKPNISEKSSSSTSHVNIATSTSVSQDITYLNVNQSVTALTCGKLKPNSNQDILVIGTATSVLAYDVHNNCDIFYKEVPDGANVLAIGKLGANEDPVLIVGGNCSIQGFDHEGKDCFWTVTGDNVCSLAFSDFTGDGKNELVVGSEDFDIRVFQDDEMIGEMSETESVVGLSNISGGRFAYALANGTVGVYQKSERSWRIKSRNQPVSIFSFDLDGDGVLELITGWSNGKIDARSDQSGEVIFKDTFSRPIAAVIAGDYRMDGNELLICASTDGEIRGYRAALASDCRESLMDVNIEQETVRELSQRKQNLYLELKNYENNTHVEDSQVKLKSAHHTADEISYIPADTQLQTGLAINLGSEDMQAHVEVAVATTNSTIIRAVIIFAEGIFESESLVVHPTESSLSSSVRVPIFPPKDVPVDLHIKAFVGHKAKSHFHVFEVTRHLPRFSMYALCLEPLDNPQSSVKFTLQERIPRVVMWINQSFLVMEDIEVKNNLNLTFLCLRTSLPLIIKMENTGEVVIMIDDMDAAGDLIQSLASFLNIEELQVTADFPDELEEITQIIDKITDIQNARQQLSADMADNSSIIRSFIVRAEDSRLMGDMKNMKKCYTELFNMNKDLINRYKIRCNNHQDLVTSLKQINLVVQKAGRLRVGKSKTLLVNACRIAIKTSNLSNFVKFIKLGASS